MAKWKEPIRATDYKGRAEAAEAEVARLREALSQINVGDGWAARIARAALSTDATE